MKSEKSRSRIARLREKAGLTQLELSRIVGVTETTIANWERGRSGTDVIEKIIKLCWALDCQLEELIEFDPSKVSPDESENKTSFSKLRQVYKEGKRSPAKKKKSRS